MSSESSENLCWYVLNHISPSLRDTAQRAVDRFNAANGTELELFAPTYVVREERQGELKFRTVSLAFHYVFVRGNFSEVKALCGQPNGFSFLIDHGSADRYAVIDDRRMSHFMTIARAYKNCLPYFPIDDVDLEDGDLVEVVKGDFPGLVGIYMPNAKSKTGNIVLNVYNKVGTMAFNVKVSDVRVLEFSKNSTRANDQIDAFVPHLLKALRHYDNSEALSTSLAAKLAVFCGRMEVVKLNNRKLDARLQILLYVANHIIGNATDAEKAMMKFERVKDSVTNEWTKGLINLVLSVLKKDKVHLTISYNSLQPLKATSKAQQMLMAEYGYYLSPETSVVS